VSKPRIETARRLTHERLFFYANPTTSRAEFRDLVVWQKAHEFVLAVYRLTESLPDREKSALSGQTRRAAVSIPANIAEGFGNRSQPEKARFPNIAEGSLEECRYYLILAQDLGHGETNSLMQTLEEAGRLLNAYARAILACDTVLDYAFSPQVSEVIQSGAAGGGTGFSLLASGVHIPKGYQGRSIAT
jgi:four helix bundle protein